MQEEAQESPTWTRLTIIVQEDSPTRDEQHRFPLDEIVFLQGLPMDRAKARLLSRQRTLFFELHSPLTETAREWLNFQATMGRISKWSVEQVEVKEQP